MKPRNFSTSALIQRLGIASIVFCSIQPLSAQFTWNGTTNNNWTEPANWSPGIPPEGGDITISDSTANGLTLDDGSHTLGTITFGTTGTRTSGFTFQTTNANTLTIAGGFTALGNFGGVGPRLRGNYVISADQSWQVGGAQGSHALDRGVAFNEVSGGNPGSVVFNADLNKSGSGQLTLAAGTYSGAGDINLNEGSIKLNAGGSLPLVISGPGKLAANFSSTLILSQNSGTFDVTRPFQFNNTSSLETGSGTGGKTGVFEIASDMEWNGIHTITNQTGAVDYEFSGVMSGSGLVTKSGPRHVWLGGTGSNTLSGIFTVTEGELHLNKTAATAIAGDILITGGSVRMEQPDQIVDSADITVTGGQFINTGGHEDTIASLTISSGATSSVSGLDVAGATTFTNGIHEVNSGQTFTTDSLHISNNAALRLVGNAGEGQSSVANIGAGGLVLDTGRVIYGNAGNTSTIQLNLAGDVVSTGTSLFTATNYDGQRIIDLQGDSRSFAVGDGTLDIRTSVRNGTLVKSGEGTLILSAAGSTGDFSFTEGPVQVAAQVDAGNVTLSGGQLLMDVGGDTPARITTTGDFTASGGSIELSALEGPITPGTVELVRYGGTLTGTPAVNIPAELAASRMNPVVDYGTGADSSITLTSTALPLTLTWHGGGGGVWDDTASSFNGGSETFHPLDSVIFDDAGISGSIQLDSEVFPTDVVFDHGDTRATYTLSGTGGIAGTAKLTKDGTGTTIIATDNSYTGGTDILGGILQVGDGGLTGSLGTGPVFVEAGATLEFARDGVLVFDPAISGSGDLVASGPGTVALTTNNDDFTGSAWVTGGTLQFGNGGATGSLGLSPVEISAGATVVIQRTGTPTIANSFSGEGALTIIGGGPILTGFNMHSGGVTVTGDGHLRVPSDNALGDWPMDLIPDAVRLDFGGLKNQDSDTVVDSYRGLTISGEAYFTAGWSKSLTIAGPITGEGDIFVNYDSGRVIFSDPTSDWDGVLTLGADKPGATGTTGGNLEIDTITNGGVPGPLGIASADPANLVFNGGRLIYSGDEAATDRGFTLAAQGTFEVVFSSLAMNGQATGEGSLRKVGDGILTLGGENDFVGNVIADDGVLAITHTDALGDPSKTLIVAGNAGAGQVPEFQLSGGISPTVAEVQTSGAGVDGATGVLRNISGDNTLNITNQLTLRTGVAGSTFYSDAGTLTINAPLIIANATNRFVTLAGPGDGTINAVIADGTTVNLPVTKNGSGTWSLNGAHTYSGATTVNEGVLSLGQASLHDEAAVVIGENGTLDLNFAGTDAVGSLTINGELKENGIYNAQTDPGFITGDGSIRVGPAEGGYDSWLAGFSFQTGVNDGPNDDPDGDGIDNLLEYVLGGVPVGAGAGDTSILPSQTVTDTDVVLTFERSVESRDDVTLKVQWSDDLASWQDFATVGSASALPEVSVTPDTPSAGLDTIVVTVPRSLADGGTIFVRLHAVR